MAARRKSNSPEPQPSLPPSPVEQDISRAGTFNEESTLTEGYTPTSAKGKERQHDTYREVVEEESDVETGVEGYPPTKDEEAESRKVEENLRRWEMAERERRKAARESATVRSSMVGDATWTASSLLWPRRSKRGSGGGSHHKLQTTEDGLPLDEIDTPAPSAPPSPEPTENPFLTPAASTTSLPLKDPQISAVMEGSSIPPTPAVELESRQLTVPTAKRPTLTKADSRSSVSHPPPQPLDLPKPRSPPPRTATPHANRPPEPIPPPSPTPKPQEEDGKDRRWWTDWLCGCSESSGHQAGRTNPFE